MMMLTEFGYYSAFLILCLVTGMCTGSFMNVVIYRLPLMITGVDRQVSLAWPPSHCPVCHGRIRIYDNIPVASWLVLRGKCRCCGSRIPLIYPLTEAVTGLWFAAVYLGMTDSVATFLTFSGAVALLPPLTLFCLLYCITVTDFRHYLIPDTLSLGLLWVGLLFSVCSLIPVSPFQSVTGAALAYCILLLIQKGFQVIRKYDGLGSGDVKLFAAVSAWMGLTQVPWLILFSAVSGGILFAIQYFYRQRIVTPFPAEEMDNDEVNMAGLYIPLGPAIAFAAMLLFFTGQ